MSDDAAAVEESDSETDAAPDDTEPESDDAVSEEADGVGIARIERRRQEEQ
jgi:hypothetical protein